MFPNTPPEVDLDLAENIWLNECLVKRYVWSPNRHNILNHSWPTATFGFLARHHCDHLLPNTFLIKIFNNLPSKRSQNEGHSAVHFEPTLYTIRLRPRQLTYLSQYTVMEVVFSNHVSTLGVVEGALQRRRLYAVCSAFFNVSPFHILPCHV